MTTQFDFIVVGAGSAGCALVYQLVQNLKHRVLLLEAGGDHHRFFVSMPMGFPVLHDNPRFDWMYRQEPPSNRSAETSSWKAGKLLGGGSSINGMNYVRGQPEDYDGWEQLGNPGWGWSDVLPLYKAMESHQLGADDMRGSGGPLLVTCMDEPNPLADAYIAAGVQMGLPARTDLNRADQVGVGYFPRTIYKGRRQSAAVAFLDRVMGKPNLTVMKGVTVRKVVVENLRAVGVECEVNGELTTFHAAKEIVVSTGTMGSPKLLQLSGIGPGAHLSSLGIRVVRDLPGVGANLQEHLSSGCVHTVRRGSQNTEVQGLRLVKNVLKYALTHRGIMTLPPGQVGAFFKTHPDLTRADAQLTMAPLSMATKANPSVPAVSDPGGTMVPSTVGGLTSFACPLRPTPGGDVMIQSPDFKVAPRIRYEHLRSETDQQAMVAIIRVIRKIAGQPALAAFGLEEALPGPAVQTDEALLDYALNTGQLGYHPVGTCKMGRDEMAVVGSELKVHGIAGLRVADASIMPTLTSGNTNAPSMMIGFKLGAMMASEYAK